MDAIMQISNIAVLCTYHTQTICEEAQLLDKNVRYSIEFCSDECLEMMDH